MTIKKKLSLSNILMIAVPVLLAAAFAAAALRTYVHSYVAPVLEMYEAENGVYSAQNVIYACKDVLSSPEEWKKYDWYEDHGLVMSEQTSPKMKMLEETLRDMGYHFEIAISRKVVYSNFLPEDRAYIDRNFGPSLAGVESLSMTDGGGSIVKNGFGPERERGSITAVFLAKRRGGVRGDSYVQKYVVAFLAVFLIFILLTVALTDYLLSGAVSRMILKPLRILKLGAREIAGGNLDFRPDYAKDDEFGDVCREFDRMRARLKESVAEKLRYENYRRELLSGISHDLRTPLTAIRGYAEGLTDGVADTSEKQRRYCQAIRSGTMEVEALADSLLLFSRLENKRYRYRRERVLLDGWLDGLIRHYRAASGGRLRLNYENRAPSFEAELDVQEMRRVFVNLFDNSVRHAGKDDVSVSVRVEAENGWAKIAVADDGAGVAADDLPHIFESFYRGDKSRAHHESGSGLGLAVARQVVEGHGGTIAARNDGGLTVEIRIPEAAAAKGAE